MSTKRKAIFENLTNKKNRTGSDIVSLRGSSENMNMSTDMQIKGDFTRMSKSYLMKELEDVKEITKRALTRKDNMCAKLKQEKETLELSMCLLEDENETLENKKVEFILERKRQEEKRDAENRIVEQFVENLNSKVENQSNEVQKLVREVDSLERNENYLKNTLESLEVDIKYANKQLVEKDQEIYNLKEVGSEEVLFYKQANKALEIKVTTLEMENEMFNKSVLNKDIELGNIAKENHELIENVRILQVDLNEKSQEISDLESIHKSKERKISLLNNAKKKSEKITSELDKKKDIEFDNVAKELRENIDILQKDLQEKNRTIRSLEAAQKDKETQINVLETDWINLTVKHETESGERKSVCNKLKGVEESLVLMHTELNRKEALLVEKEQELKIIKRTEQEKGFITPIENVGSKDSPGNISNVEENLKKEIQEKSSRIEKQKNEIIVLETNFKDKISALHSLSKAHAELSRQHDLDTELLKVKSNLTKKYFDKIKILKYEIKCLSENNVFEDNVDKQKEEEFNIPKMEEEKEESKSFPASASNSKHNTVKPCEKVEKLDSKITEPATEEHLKNNDKTMGNASDTDRNKVILIEILNKNLRVSEVTEKLKLTGPVTEYWFERPKAMCWVSYKNTKQACETQKELDGKFWFGAKLKVSFSSLEELRKSKKDTKNRSYSFKNPRNFNPFMQQNIWLRENQFNQTFQNRFHPNSYYDNHY